MLSALTCSQAKLKRLDQDTETREHQNHFFPNLNLRIVQDDQVDESDNAKNFVSRLRDSRQARLRNLQETLKERLDSFRARSSTDDSTSIYRFNFDLPYSHRSATDDSEASARIGDQPAASDRQASGLISYDDALGNDALRLERYQPAGLLYYRPRVVQLARSRRTPRDFNHQRAQPGDLIIQQPQTAASESSIVHEPPSDHLMAASVWPAQGPNEYTNREFHFGQRSVPSRARFDDVAQDGPGPIPPDPRVFSAGKRPLIETGVGPSNPVRFDEPAVGENLRPAGSYDRMNIHQDAGYDEKGIESCNQDHKGNQEYEMPAKKVVKEEKHHHHYHHHLHQHEPKKEPAKQEASKKPTPTQPVQLEIHIKGKGKGKSKSKDKGKGKKKEKSKMKEGDEIYVKFKQGEGGKQEKYSSSASGEHESDQMDHKEGEYLVDEKASLLNDKEDSEAAQVEAKPLQGGPVSDDVSSREDGDNKSQGAAQHELAKTINTSQVPNHYDSYDETTEYPAKKETNQKHGGAGLRKTSKRKEKKVVEEVEVEEVEEKKHGGEEKELPVANTALGTKKVDKKEKTQEKPKEQVQEQPKKVEEKIEEKKVEEKLPVEKPKPVVKEPKKDIQLHMKLGLEKSKHQHIEVHEHKHFENHQHINLNNQPIEEKVPHEEPGYHEHEHHQFEHEQQHAHPYLEDQHLAHQFETHGYHGEQHDVPVKDQWLMPGIHKAYEKHPLEPLVIEDHSALELGGKHHHEIGYTEETANHPHGIGLSPSGVRPLMGAFSNRINVHIGGSETNAAPNDTLPKKESSNKSAK